MVAYLTRLQTFLSNTYTCETLYFTHSLLPTSINAKKSKKEPWVRNAYGNETRILCNCSILAEA